eukprot:4294619-Heterocapsa_arctica.AAC.1
MNNNTQQRGVFQNVSKRQLLFAFRGRGRHAHQRAIQQADCSGRLHGKIAQHALHLGSWHSARNNMAKEVSTRIEAAKRAWSTFRGCWFQPRIPLKLR